MTDPKTPWKRRGCLYAALVPALLLAVGAGYLFYALRLSEDAPLARMYRTEATLRLLARAVDGYRDAHGQYPPPGPAGLDRAVAHLSSQVPYLPEGAPFDAWGRPYAYVPAEAYADPDSPALRDPSGAYYAPQSYQLYSAGADGDPGTGNPEAQQDNIVSWDPGRSWRPLYRELNRRHRQDSP